MRSGEPRVGDAWGRALLDYLGQRDVAQLLLEVDGGRTGPAMHPEWFFRSFDEWDWWDRELLSRLGEGPVLDLGCGAGRTALHLQGLGFAVTAVDNSQGAIEVCRRRGVLDARVGDLNEPPDDHQWCAVLLMCGNLGLGGSWEGNRALLTKLAGRCAPGAVLIGDSVNFDDSGDLRLRIRYGDMVTPWWRQRNVSAAELPALVAGTGWRVERQIEDGTDHAALLRRADDATLAAEHAIAASPIQTARLDLVPLSETDAIDMVEVLADVALYEYTGGASPSLEDLRFRFARQAAGSPDPEVIWLNWILRRRRDGRAVGTTQAEIVRGLDGVQATIAWVTGRPFQGNGFASEAAAAVVSFLVAEGVDDIHATIHPDHRASARVARRVGLVATVETRDGETVWRRPVRQMTEPAHLRSGVADADPG